MTNQEQLVVNALANGYTIYRKVGGDMLEYEMHIDKHVIHNIHAITIYGLKQQNLITDKHSLTTKGHRKVRRRQIENFKMLKIKDGAKRKRCIFCGRRLKRYNPKWQDNGKPANFPICKNEVCHSMAREMSGGVFQRRY